MVSSGMGSFGVTQDRSRLESTIWGIVYPSSKAALNMVTTMYAKSLPDVRVTAVDPGYTATNLNGFSGPQTVPEGAEPIVEACVADELAGGFVGRSGPLPW
jgi:NAD(P)-dependent dehydrogenase (short-subunit alcohol dehydrogenase family)